MSLTRDDITKYKSTKNEIERNAIEMQTIDDSFETDALEGWSDPKLSINRLKSLDRKFIHSKFYLYLSSIFIVLSVGLIVYFVNNHQNHLGKDSLKDKIDKQHVNTPTIHPDTVRSFKSLPLKLQITPQNIRNDFEAKETFESNELKNIVSNDMMPAKLPLKKVDKIETEIKHRSNPGKETYLQNLKVIDYRYYRARPTDQVKDPLSGTPAENESQTNSVSEENSVVEISYVSFLEKSLKLFNSNQFKDALNRFETILETYPDDVNTLFYSSICLYNLNQFDLCEKRLLQLQNGRFTNFDQEQQWYLLLTYKAQYKKELFEKLRSSIINEKGFYSKKAERLVF